MCREEITNIVVGKIKEHFLIENVAMDAKLITDLGADSLDQVELIMGIEDKFNIEIPDDDATNLITVEDLINYIEKRTGEVK